MSTIHIKPNVSNLPHTDALLIHSNNSFPAKVTPGTLVTSSPHASLSKFIFHGTRLQLDIKLPPSRENHWAFFIESPDSQKTVENPADYRAFQDIFSKFAASRLPKHRPWEYKIDLLPGAKLPKGRVYLLLIPERAAMEEYIRGSPTGVILPTTSSAASSFFFVAKTDGGLTLKLSSFHIP